MRESIEESVDAGRRVGNVGHVLTAGRVEWRTARLNVYDVATIAFVGALVVIALSTFGDYAISNDEEVQHRYGELIVAYYTSGFGDQSLFKFDNLYLYGGLFDVVVVLISRLIPIDPYDLRHILCALVGIGAVGTTAAIARLIAGPRAALFAAVGLSVTGAWYGAMFNHTKDIPFATAMIGATLLLIRLARSLPSPRAGDVAAFGLLAGAALGMRVLGLLLVIYVGFAIVFYSPPRWPDRCRFAIISALELLPAFVLAYVIMILAWPWAALAPLNPVRGLFAFADFQFGIRTLLAGRIYDMANVPRLYVPIYILVRMPLVMLFGVVVAIVVAIRPGRTTGERLPAKDVALVSLTVIVPLICQVALHGPAFTGLRHFLFVIPSLAVLAGIGCDKLLTALAARGRAAAATGVVIATVCVLWNAVTLVRLHPYQYLFYNTIVGGLEGASRRYDLDYWFGSMPEALTQLESYLRRTAALDHGRPAQVYSVAVCGERAAFEKTVTLPQLRWDFKPEWEQSEFFIAPTHMNCDVDLDGKVIGTVERLGVTIAYIKDRRALMRPMNTVAR